MAAIDLTLAEPFGALDGDQNLGERWTLLRNSLANAGFDKLAYTFLDGVPAATGEPAINPSLSTMPQDWLAHYAHRRLDRVDPLVLYTKAGGVTPLLFDAVNDPDSGEVSSTAHEAGMVSGLVVPLPRAVSGIGPIAGMVIGSGLQGSESHRIIRENGADLVAVAHMFHASVAGEALRRREGAAPLTPRERDCLQAIAHGDRISAIAWDLKLAEVTVAMHLKNARRKLGARSLPEAVAKGLLFQQIQLG